MVPLHLVLAFFEQKPKLFYLAIQSSLQKLIQELTKIEFCILLEKLYSDIPSYPSVPVDFKFTFALLHSIIVFDDLATTLEK